MDVPFSVEIGEVSMNNGDFPISGGDFPSVWAILGLFVYFERVVAMNSMLIFYL